MGGQNRERPVCPHVSSGTSQPIGSLTKVTYGSSDNDNFTYDVNTGRLTQYLYKVGTTPQTVTGNLGWNANASLASLGITDQLSSQNTQTCAFSYDDLARVSTANCGSTVWSQTFSFDPFGNVSKTANPGISFTPTYNLSTNRYSAIPGCSTFAYLGNGEMTNDCVHAYSTDNFGNMYKIDSTSIVYDALGRMVEQNNSGSYTQVVYGPTGAKLALASVQTLKKAFIPLPGGGSAVYNSSGLAYYRHADWLGSSRLATNTSQSSQASYYYDGAYAPYGEPYAGSGTTDLDFTGKNQDTAAGLYDFHFREYNSSHGRWPQPDPAGLNVVSMLDPQTWNRYAYVSNHPLNSVDPAGFSREFTDAVSPQENTCYLTFSCTVYTDTYGMAINPQVALMELHNGSGVICSVCQPGSSVDALNQVWGWKSPNGVAAPMCGFLACTTVSGGQTMTPGRIALIAYWGIIGIADDRTSQVCAIGFCGANGDSVFNRVYPRNPREASLTAIGAPPKMSFEQIATWCAMATFLSGGGSAWGTPADVRPTYVSIYDQHGNFQEDVPLDPVSSAQGSGITGGVSMVGSIGGCIGVGVGMNQ